MMKSISTLIAAYAARSEWKLSDTELAADAIWDRACDFPNEWKASNESRKKIV